MTEEFDVALFPIPSLVAFPGTNVPLHVFEPRYRQLIHDCLEQQRMVGVCHTRKTIREARAGQTADEILSSNQATYQPQEVFSAGPCKLHETTSDGRLLAEICVSHRLEIVREIQTLPYRVVTARLLVDEAEENPDEITELERQITALLGAILKQQNPELGQVFAEKKWTPGQFSFEIFQYLRFEPDLMQEILETRSVGGRLKLIKSILDP